MTGKPTWGGRIAGGRDPRATEFLDHGWDEHLIEEQDIVATIAHVGVLTDAGLLTTSDAKKLIAALRRIETPVFEPSTHEDVHSALEASLTAELGELGARVHAGRSRNDLVATDLRLFVRSATVELAEAVLDLRDVLTDRAAEHAATLAPGYTHLQRAQPVTVGHWLLGYAEAFARDTTRIVAAHEVADVCPLGAGALAGNTLGLDPGVAARSLGFSRPFTNSLDAVAARDFVADACYAYAMTATDLSRLGEEIVLWSSAEFSYVRLPDTFATGSSMMPQKKNPDVAEVSRAEPGAAVAALMDVLVTTKGLPFAYNRDLQAVKRTLPTLLRAPVGVRAMTGLVSEIGFDAERLRAAVSDDTLFATDLAEALVAEGVPFRTAHERVAGLVRTAEGSGRTLREAIEDSPDALEPMEAEEALALLEAGGAVDRRTTPGGPSKRSVQAQIRAHRRAVASDRKAVAALRERLPDRRSAGT